MFITHSRCSHKLCQRLRPASSSEVSRRRFRGGILKPHLKRGQSTLEYMLLIAMVAGVVTTFRVLLFPPLIDNLEKITSSAGGPASQGGTSRFGSYYSQSQTFSK